MSDHGYGAYDREPFGSLAEHGTPGLADDFFRYHDKERTLVLDGGDVESPQGFFELLEVRPEVVAEYASRMGDPWVTMASNFPTGWYILQTNSDGILTGHYYGSQDATIPEEKARSDFGKLEEAYAEWSNLENEVSWHGSAERL